MSKSRDKASPGRRDFLKLAALASAGVLAHQGAAAQFATSKSPKWPVRMVEARDFDFEPETGMVRYEERHKTVRTEPYALTMDGLVEKPVTLSYKEIKALPQNKQTTGLHCVEGWSVYDIQWKGVRFQELFKLVKPSPKATHLFFHSLGQIGLTVGGRNHYFESMPIDYLLEPDNQCMLALRANGAPLVRDHGAPARLVAPLQLGYKNIKFVTRIEFVDEERPGWWTEVSPIYKIDAPVPKSRLKE